MPNTIKIPAPLHNSAPIIAQLVACGMLGRAEALAALVTIALPANVSECGRHATLSQSEPVDRVNRVDAARAARTVLQTLLAARVSPRVLRIAARAAASSGLNRSEVDRLANDSIARHLRAQRLSAAASLINARQSL